MDTYVPFLWTELSSFKHDKVDVAKCEEDILDLVSFSKKMKAFIIFFLRSLRGSLVRLMHRSRRSNGMAVLELEDRQ